MPRDPRSEKLKVSGNPPVVSTRSWSGIPVWNRSRKTVDEDVRDATIGLSEVERPVGTNLLRVP